jgi:hypothetical protein
MAALIAFATPAFARPEQFAQSFDAAIATWSKVAADANLKFE